MKFVSTLAIPAIALAVAAGCGVRTQLDSHPSEDRDAGRDRPPDGGPPDTGPPDAGSLEGCIYRPDGAPIELVSDDVHGFGLESPMLIPLDPGQPGEPARAMLAITHDHFWHPDMRAAELLVGARWAEDVRVERRWVPWTVDMHSNAYVAPTPAGAASLYYRSDNANGEPSGIAFQTFDASRWAASPEILLEDNGTPHAIAHRDGRYLVAYAVSRGNAALSTVALVDADGRFVSGPVTLAPEPGASPTGTAAAFALDGSMIVADDGGASIRLHRWEPDGAGFVPIGSVPALAGLDPLRPTLLTAGDATWLAWRELDPSTTAPGVRQELVLRIARLSADGAPLGVRFEHRSVNVPPALHAAADGLFVAWSEVVDPALPPSEVGHGRLRAAHVRSDGEAPQMLELPTAAAMGYLSHSILSIEEPRSLLVAWLGMFAESPNKRVMLARFDCVLP